MSKWQEFFKEKRITMLGLGVLGRGIGVAKFLSEEGAILTITDKKTKEELAPALEELKNCKNITYVLGEHRFEDFGNKDMVIKAAGVPLDSPYVEYARKQGIPIEMDASLFCKLAPGGVTTIGITGTRGKSTVTQFIYEILKNAGKRVFLGGNVRGIATLPLLRKVEPSLKGSTFRMYVVFELDSWQLQGFGEAKISPHVGVFTTFLNDHMNYYKGNVNAYWEDKANIFKFQSNSDYLIVSNHVAPKIKNQNAKIKIVDAKDSPKGWKLKILGEHNKLNAALAIEAARALGVPEEKIKSAVENFGGIEGRLQYLGEKRGVHIWNDNNATTPDATIAAIRALREKYPKSGIVLIAGGADKELDFEELAKLISREVKVVILFEGAASDKLKVLLPWAEIFVTSGVKSMRDAVTLAFEEAGKGAILLLSPGAASFGVFKNEYDRNDQFVAEVKKYA